ncbi:MAG: methyltransferase domain-containing protein [Halomonas sp.]|uniref:methyltransferase domain-containing protein n=1 Tax=Halomonas sp. TaxID=1486246 RepID=UPI003F90B97E
MTSPGDLDALIRRLSDSANSLDEDQPPIAPPLGDWYQQLTELRDCLEKQPQPLPELRHRLVELRDRLEKQPQPLPGLDLHRLAELRDHLEKQQQLLLEFNFQRLADLREAPGLHSAVTFPSNTLTDTAWRHIPERFSLSVLIAPNADDSTFIDGLYQHLLGRAADDEGKANYLHSLSRHCRLYVLGEFLQSPETIAALEDRPPELTQALKKLSGTWRRYHSAGPVSRITSKLLNLGWTWRARLNCKRWRQDSLHAQQKALWATTTALCINQQQQADALRENQQQLADALCQVDEVLREMLPAWHTERYQLASAVLEMGDRQRHFGQRQDYEYARQLALWQQFAAWRRANSAPSRLITEPEALQATESVAAPPSELDTYYLAFEAAFRGPEADIAAHLNNYCDAWTRARQVGDQALDLGCGRGEWLRLLAQAGFQPRGIDLNATMVAHCRELGFTVAQQDALDALRNSADASLALISGFHIAEHLPFETLFTLVAEAHRALAPGGVLILETPNPENLIVASYSFYHDLTHRNPLTPPTLQFLLQFHGFSDTIVQRFNPPPDDTRVASESPAAQRLNTMLAAPMDYAVIGTKAEEKHP